MSPFCFEKKINLVCINIQQIPFRLKLKYCMIRFHILMSFYLVKIDNELADTDAKLDLLI